MIAARRSMGFMVIFVALWVVIETLGADLMRPYSPYEIVWTRYGVHLAFMLALWGWREPLSLVRTKRPIFQISRSLLMLVMPVAWVFALRLGASEAFVAGMFGLSPLMILALGSRFLGESPSWRLWAAAAAASVGALLLIKPFSPPPAAAVVCALATAVSFSLYVVMTRSLRTDLVRTNLFYTALGVFVVLSLVMPHHWVAPLPHDLVIMVLIGVLGLGALFALDRMAETAPVSCAAALTNLQLVFTLGLGVGLGHQHLGVLILAGALLLCGVALYLWWRPSVAASRFA